MKNLNDKKILLGLLPFWTPLVPPMGIACLKSFLQQHGYVVKTFDSNIEEQFKDVYNRYFSTLGECIQESERGNFYNIGHDLLQNHLMAFLNYENEEEYTGLVKTLVLKNFNSILEYPSIEKLNEIIKEFFVILEKYILGWLTQEKPAVLGLSVFRGTLPASLFAFKITRTKYPHIKTVMGGGIFSQELEIHSENLKFFLEETRYMDYIDQIIIGEGEILFLKFLQGRLHEFKQFYSLEDIDNQTLDLTKVNPPDFSDFNIQYYTYVGGYTSRSCPFQCNFCAETMYWGKYRKKHSQQVVKELQALFEKYNFQLFLMCDSLLNPIITELAKEFLKKDISLYWDGYLRADRDVCNREKVLLWRQGGFYRARIGVESGSPSLLELMEKKITPAQTKEALTNLAGVGIKTTTYWIVGYPGETEKDFQQTLDFIEELKDDIYEAECNPFRYFKSGQINSWEWVGKKNIPLYPGNAKKSLIIQTWVIDDYPTRKETMKRLNRFAAHCKKLGIPNPYSLHDIHQADERWQNLHLNAVPPVVAFKDQQSYIEENKHVRELKPLKNKMQDNGEFGF